MNSVNLIGRACAAPSIKYVGQTHRALAEFTLAYDDPFNKDPQTGKTRAYFFLIVIWGNKAEVAAQHIVKGQRIGITGRLVQEQYVPKDGDKPVTKTRIIAETFDLLEKPQGYQSSDSSYRPPAAAAAPAAGTAAAEDNDEIPF